MNITESSSLIVLESSTYSKHPADESEKNLFQLFVEEGVIDSRGHWILEIESPIPELNGEEKARLDALLDTPILHIGNPIRLTPQCLPAVNTIIGKEGENRYLKKDQEGHYRLYFSPFTLRELLKAMKNESLSEVSEIALTGGMVIKIVGSGYFKRALAVAGKPQLIDKIPAVLFEEIDNRKCDCDIRLTLPGADASALASTETILYNFLLKKLGCDGESSEEIKNSFEALIRFSAFSKRSCGTDYSINSWKDSNGLEVDFLRCSEKKLSNCFNRHGWKIILEAGRAKMTPYSGSGWATVAARLLHLLDGSALDSGPIKSETWARVLSFITQGDHCLISDMDLTEVAKETPETLFKTIAKGADDDERRQLFTLLNGVSFLLLNGFIESADALLSKIGKLEKGIFTGELSDAVYAKKISAQELFSLLWLAASFCFEAENEPIKGCLHGPERELALTDDRGLKLLLPHHIAILDDIEKLAAEKRGKGALAFLDKMAGRATAGRSRVVELRGAAAKIADWVSSSSSILKKLAVEMIAFCPRHEILLNAVVKALVETDAPDPRLAAYIERVEAAVELPITKCDRIAVFLKRLPSTAKTLYSCWSTLPEVQKHLLAPSFAEIFKGDLHTQNYYGKMIEWRFSNSDEFERMDLACDLLNNKERLPLLSHKFLDTFASFIKNNKKALSSNIETLGESSDAEKKLKNALLFKPVLKAAKRQAPEKRRKKKAAEKPKATIAEKCSALLALPISTSRDYTNNIDDMLKMEALVGQRPALIERAAALLKRKSANCQRLAATCFSLMPTLVNNADLYLELAELLIAYDHNVTLEAEEAATLLEKCSPSFDPLSLMQRGTFNALIKDHNIKPDVDNRLHEAIEKMVPEDALALIAAVGTIPEGWKKTAEQQLITSVKNRQTTHVGSVLQSEIVSADQLVNRLIEEDPQVAWQLLQIKGISVTEETQQRWLTREIAQAGADTKLTSFFKIFHGTLSPLPALEGLIKNKQYHRAFSLLQSANTIGIKEDQQHRLIELWINQELEEGVLTHKPFSLINNPSLIDQTCWSDIIEALPSCKQRTQKQIHTLLKSLLPTLNRGSVAIACWKRILESESIEGEDLKQATDFIISSTATQDQRSSFVDRLHEAHLRYARREKMPLAVDFCRKLMSLYNNDKANYSLAVAITVEWLKEDESSRYCYFSCSQLAESCSQMDETLALKVTKAFIESPFPFINPPDFTTHIELLKNLAEMGSLYKSDELWQKAKECRDELKWIMSYQALLLSDTSGTYIQNKPPFPFDNEIAALAHQQADTLAASDEPLAWIVALRILLNTIEMDPATVAKSFYKVKELTDRIMVAETSSLLNKIPFCYEIIASLLLGWFWVPLDCDDKASTYHLGNTPAHLFYDLVEKLLNKTRAAGVSKETRESFVSTALQIVQAISAEKVFPSQFAQEYFHLTGLIIPPLLESPYENELENYLKELLIFPDILQSLIQNKGDFIVFFQAQAAQVKHFFRHCPREHFDKFMKVMIGAMKKESQSPSEEEFENQKLIRINSYLNLAAIIVEEFIVDRYKTVSIETATKIQQLLLDPEILKSLKQINLPAAKNSEQSRSDLLQAMNQKILSLPSKH